MIRVVFLFILLVGCSDTSRTNRLILKSNDNREITVISDYMNNTRFIINGKHKTVPKYGYYELDISKVSNIGDNIGICWQQNTIGWQLANNKAKVVQAKIDTTLYIFKEKWYTDDIGIPNTKYYHRDNCFTVDLLNYTNYYPPENGSVERNVF